MNSWRIPNDTRVPADVFEQFLRAAPAAFRRDATALRALRDDLRAGLAEADRGEPRPSAWIRRLGLLPVVAEEALRFGPAGGAHGRARGTIAKVRRYRERHRPRGPGPRRGT